MKTETRRWRDRVLLDASGELGEADRVALRRAMDDHAELRDFARSVAVLSRETGAWLPDDGPSPETLARIQEAARKACGHRRVLRFPRVSRPVLALAASLLVVAGIWVASWGPGGRAGVLSDTGMAALDDLLALVGEGDAVVAGDGDSGTYGTAVPVSMEGLAAQLLRMQGFALDDASVGDAATIPEAPDPTTSRGRSIPAVPAGRRV